MMKLPAMKNVPMIVVAGLLLALNSCYYAGPCIQGYGPVRTEIRSLEDFYAVSNTASFDVIVTLADTFGVMVEAQDNLHELIETYVSGSSLIVKTRNGTCIKPAAPVIVHVSLPYLEEIRNTGSGRISADRAISDEFEISNSGSGYAGIDTIVATNIAMKNTGSGQVEVLESMATEVDLTQTGSGGLYAGTMFNPVDLNVNHTSSGSVFGTVVNGVQADVRMTGSGKVILSGDAGDGEFTLTSSGKIDALDLYLDDAGIYVSGSGKVYVNASGTLDVVITSSGDVYYLGSPQNIFTRITGSGSVSRYD